jgi:hypothetical protein
MGKIYVGIDNGVSGSMGAVWPDGDWRFKRTPIVNEQDYTKTAKRINRLDHQKFYETISKVKRNKEKHNVLIIMERPLVNAKMFKATVSGVRCFEAQLVMIESLRLPYQVIDSKQWQKVMLPKIKNTKRNSKKDSKKKKETKQASLSVGKKLFPGSEKKADDCDGLLIAEWARREKL